MRVMPAWGVGKDEGLLSSDSRVGRWNEEGKATMRLRTTLAALPATLLLPTVVANASNHVQTVVTFDAAVGELLEGWRSTSEGTSS